MLLRISLRMSHFKITFKRLMLIELCYLTDPAVVVQHQDLRLSQ